MIYRITLIALSLLFFGSLAMAGLPGSSITLTQSDFDTVCNNGVIERKFKGVCPSSWTAGALSVQGGGGSVSGLLTLSDINYVGAFRPDGNTFGASGVQYTDKHILAINPQNGNLLITGATTENTRDIGEFEIPALSTSTSVSDLPIAANTQPFVDVFDQIPSRNADSDETNGVGIYGMYAIDNDVIMNYAVYYDASSPVADESIFIKRNASDLDASTGDTVGAFKFDCGTLCSGWISPIPSEWQSALGGDHIAGWASGTTRAIISRLSLGPSAYAFNIADLTSPPAAGSTINTVPLMSFAYPNAMGIAGDTVNVDTYLDGPGTLWNKASTIDYCVIVPGSDTYLCLGHDAGYLSGLGYKLRTNTSQTDLGDYDANSVTDYRNIYALIDVNDFVDARNGVINVHDIIPYEWGAFTAQFGGTPETGINRISGCAYDPVTGRLYVSVVDADDVQSAPSSQPVIEVYTFGGGS